MAETSRRFALTALIALIGSYAISPRRANADVFTLDDLNRAIALTNRQNVLAHKIWKDAITAAVDLEAPPDLGELQSMRQEFGQILAGLRDGAPELGLRALPQGNVQASVEKASGIWFQLDALLDQILGSGEVTVRDVDAMADYVRLLDNALETTAEAYWESALGGRLFSTGALGMRYSGRQLVLAQRMTVEFSLIAHGLDAERNAEDLKASIEVFQETLSGLIAGNPELRLIPAPTPDLQYRLLRVKSLWDEFGPQVAMAAETGRADDIEIDEVDRMGLEMAQELEAVIRSYEGL